MALRQTAGLVVLAAGGIVLTARTPVFGGLVAGLAFAVAAIEVAVIVSARGNVSHAALTQSCLAKAPPEHSSWSAISRRGLQQLSRDQTPILARFSRCETSYFPGAGEAYPPAGKRSRGRPRLEDSDSRCVAHRESALDGLERAFASDH